MKTKERIKTLLLTVLFVGAVFLTYSIWFYDASPSQNFMWNDEYNELSSVMIEERTSAVIPFAISYRKGEARFGAAYHYGSVNGIYEKITQTLRYVLNTATTFSSCSEDTWYAALSGNGILIDYEGDAPLCAIADSINAENGDRYVQSARYILLSPEGLYIKNSSTGETHIARHELSESNILTLIDSMSAAKCTLALDTDNEKVKPETMLFDGKISTFTLNGSSAVASLDEMQMIAFLKIFGMNYNTCGKHIEKDGTRVYIEDLNVLKVFTDGYVEYAGEYKENDNFGGLLISDVGTALTYSETVKAVNEIVAQLSHFTGGDGKMYLRSVVREGSKWSFGYGWSFGGVPIDRQETGDSAYVDIESNRIMRMGFYMRKYENGGSIVYPIPQKLAIASVTDGSESDFSLRYTDGVVSGIEAQWYTKIK